MGAAAGALVTAIPGIATGAIGSKAAGAGGDMYACGCIGIAIGAPYIGVIGGIPPYPGVIPGDPYPTGCAIGAP